MRQGQQNRRGRGRNRRGQNPLTRSFESNGPDVKIRGTPSHIAEKYMSLARDAQASGDPVLAENYLQHAEHYIRIIMAFREQQMPHGDAMNGVNRMRPGPNGEGGEAGDDFGDDDVDDMLPESGLQPVRAFDLGAQPQPVVSLDEQPGPADTAAVPAGGSQPYGSRPQRHHSPYRQHGEGSHRQHREPRDGRSHREHRDHRGPRDHRDRRERYGEDRGGYQPERNERSERPDRSERERPEPPIAVETSPVAGVPDLAPTASPSPAPARGESSGQRGRRQQFGASGDQPEFLRRPIRRPRRDTAGDDDRPAGTAPGGEDGGSGET
jgi:hypothetical protein